MTYIWIGYSSIGSLSFLCNLLYLFLFGINYVRICSTEFHEKDDGQWPINRRNHKELRRLERKTEDYLSR